MTMRMLVFDTETTGLPLYRNVPARSRPNIYPHIVSISWMILDNNQIEKTRSYIVKPAGWVVPKSASDIHGITQEMAVRDGQDLRTILTEFQQETFDIIVAHNLEFDENVVINAFVWDLDNHEYVFPSVKACTMKLGRPLCKLPSAYSGYKMPKLRELYFHVFQRFPDANQLHNSLYDVQILVEVLLKTNLIQNASWLHESADHKVLRV